MPILDLFQPPQSGGGILGMPQSSDGPAANNGMPMNIAPPQQQPQQAQPFYNNGNGNIFAALGHVLQNIGNPPGSRGYNAIQQQRQMQMTYESLQQAGLPEPLARIGAIHPEALGQLSAGYLTPPQSQNYSTPYGTGGTATYDPRTHSYKDFASGQPLPQAQPSYASPGASPYTASAPPPGVDINKFRQDEAARIAEQQKELREKAEGAIDFLPDALRVGDDIKSGKYNNAIGPVEGSSWYNAYIRGPGASADEALGSPVGVRQNLGAYNEFQATVNRLASKNLKAQYGARPSLPEVQMNRDTFGGVQSADANTAHAILSQRTLANFETLNRAVGAGVISPQALPPELVQRGVQMGALDPRVFGVGPAAAQQQPAPASNAGILSGQPQGQGAAQAVPPVTQRKVGQTYTTPKGKFVWMGSGWQAAQ